VSERTIGRFSARLQPSSSRARFDRRPPRPRHGPARPAARRPWARQRPPGPHIGPSGLGPGPPCPTPERTCPTRWGGFSGRRGTVIGAQDLEGSPSGLDLSLCALDLGPAGPDL